MCHFSLVPRSPRPLSHRPRLRGGEGPRAGSGDGDTGTRPVGAPLPRTPSGAGVPRMRRLRVPARARKDPPATADRWRGRPARP